MPIVLGAVFHFRLVLVINQLPSAAVDSAQRRARTVIGQPLSPEAAPVVGYDLIESIDDSIEGIGLKHGPRYGSAMEEMAEIVDGFLAFALLADDDVAPKPVQRVFIVEIGSAAPGVPCLRREIKFRSSVGGVLQVAPGAARSMVQVSGGRG